MAKYSSIAQISIPPLASVLDDAIRLSANKNVKVDDFCSCAFQDPVLCIELLQHANSLEFGVARVAIASIPNAIMRLGWQEVHSLVNNLTSVPIIDSPLKSKWIEIHRRRCRRSGMVARIIAETVSRDLSQPAHMCGLFLYLGDILAVLQLGDNYVNLAETNARPRVNYRIATDYGFDTEETGLDYLRITGVPRSITDVIDRNTHQKELSKHLLRPIVFAASELVESFEAGKMQRYESLSDLPNNSQLRLFKFIEAQYERMITKIKAFLISDADISNAVDEQDDPEPTPSLEQVQPQREPGAPLTEEEKIQARLPKLKALIDKSSSSTLKPSSSVSLTPLPAAEPTPPASFNEPSPAAPDEVPAPVAPPKKPVKTAEPEKPAEPVDPFGIKESLSIRQIIRSRRVLMDDEPSDSKEDKITSPMLSTSARTLSLAKDSEQLMAMILTTLMQFGFESAAIIVVAQDKTEGLVTAARGSILPGTIIKLDPAFSPIAQGISKVQSSKDTSVAYSPFSSSTFAVAPLTADHQSPVCLYADCGKDNTISFETRRTFRGLVNIINTILPRVPGGILNEIPGQK